MGALVVLVVLLIVLLWRGGVSQDDGGGAPGLGWVSEPPQPSVDAYESGSNGLDNITEAIFRYEGGKPGNLNVVNNNPGNIEKGGQFVKYSDIGDGWDALGNWVTSHSAAHPDWDFYDTFNYYLRGSTTAPSVDAQGDSDAYAEFVANYVGASPTEPVSAYLQGAS